MYNIYIYISFLFLVVGYLYQLISKSHFKLYIHHFFSHEATSFLRPSVTQVPPAEERPY